MSNRLFKYYLSIIIAGIALLNPNDSFSQVNKLIIEKNGKKDTLINSFTNEKEVIDYLSELQMVAFKNGYLSWSVDSITNDSSYFKAYLFEGNVYQWNELNIDVDQGLALKSGLDSKKLENNFVNPQEILEYLDKIIEYYETNGYPFAQVKMDEILIDEDKINGHLQVAPGPLVDFDTLAIHGNIKINKRYVGQLLGIKKGERFNQKLLNNIKKRISTTPFLEMENEPQVEFNNNQAIVHLYLKSRKANFFNGVIGVLPNTNIDPRLSTGTNLIITGDVQLKVFNTLRMGEKIKLNWKRLQALSQELEVETDFQYLFGTPFGISESFDLLKQDTSFLNFNNQLGINYSIAANKLFTVFWDSQNSTILSEKAAGNFTPNNSNSYGIMLEWEELDYPFNPRKGFYFKAAGSIGNKEIRGNTINEDQIEINVPTNQSGIQVTQLIPKISRILKFRANADFFIPIGKISTFKIGLNGGWIDNDYLFENELTRIGGFGLLRGFDEKSIFVSQYGLITLEYRILLETNSYLSVFYDQAATQKSVLFENTIDYPMGFGAGINFEVNSGVFNLSYAIGRQQGNPIEFQSAKIHFGFVSLF